jgi:hypothetical protein
MGEYCGTNESNQLAEYGITLSGSNFEKQDLDIL